MPRLHSSARRPCYRRLRKAKPFAHHGEATRTLGSDKSDDPCQRILVGHGDVIFYLVPLTTEFVSANLDYKNAHNQLRLCRKINGLDMQDEIFSLYHCSIDPANFDAFQELVAELVEATSKEPDTTIYEFVVNAGRTEVHIVERYRSAALLPHVKHTFGPYADRFLELVHIKALYVYGETTPEIREFLDGFSAIYLTPLAGFSR